MRVLCAIGESVVEGSWDGLRVLRSSGGSWVRAWRMAGVVVRRTMLSRRVVVVGEPGEGAVK